MSPCASCKDGVAIAVAMIPCSILILQAILNKDTGAPICRSYGLRSCPIIKDLTSDTVT